MTRRAARRDSNHADIVRDLRRVLGAYAVADTASMGDGFPDIVVGDARRNWLFEIKDGAKAPSKRKLTPDETEFHDTWPGQIDIIQSADDALRIMGRLDALPINTFREASQKAGARVGAR